MNFSVTKNGKPLDTSLYNWDEKTKTFSSNEDDLILDFSNISGVTFHAGSDCTFKTGSHCTFDTESFCTFKTGSGCTFNTGSYCTFNTGSGCTFEVKENCVLVRRDIFEVHTFYPNVKYILNGCGIKGFKNEDEIKMQLMENLL